MANWNFAGVVFLLIATGCGTTRTTDTSRTATEMLLVSQAVDRAVGQIDFSALHDKAVYLDTAQIDDNVVDKGYMISSLRQQLLAHGAHLRDEKRSCVYIVEVRSGAIGTDRHTLLFGTPALSIPSVLPGIPTSIPEIALMKKTDQKGVAKIAVFAYNRVTGRAVWQSGVVEESSRIKDTWVFGAGPFSRGSIRRGTTLAGESLPNVTVFGTREPIDSGHPTTVQPANGFEWVNGDVPSPPQPVPFGLLSITGAAAIVNHPLIRGS